VVNGIACYVPFVWVQLSGWSLTASVRIAQVTLFPSNHEHKQVRRPPRYRSFSLLSSFFAHCIYDRTPLRIYMKLTTSFPQPWQLYVAHSASFTSHHNYHFTLQNADSSDDEATLPSRSAPKPRVEFNGKEDIDSSNLMDPEEAIKKFRKAEKRRGMSRVRSIQFLSNSFQTVLVPVTPIPLPLLPLLLPLAPLRLHAQFHYHTVCEPFRLNFLLSKLNSRIHPTHYCGQEKKRTP